MSKVFYCCTVGGGVYGGRPRTGPLRSRSRGEGRSFTVSLSRRGLRGSLQFGVSNTGKGSLTTARAGDRY